MRIGTEVTFLETVDSTNEFIRKNIKSLKNGAVVWAQTQTEGRGRLKRNWVSDDNGNIYFSFLMKDRKWIKQLTELPIIVSVVLLRSVAAFFESDKVKDLKLKWPNDLLWKGAKLSGTLIEIDGDNIVCGIGLNIEKAPQIEGKKTACIKELTGPHEMIKQADFISIFCKEFNKATDQYLKSGFADFKSEWEQNCGHINKKVALSGGVEDNTPKMEVLFLGLNSDGGALVVFDGESEKRVVYSGELNV